MSGVNFGQRLPGTDQHNRPARQVPGERTRAVQRVQMQGNARQPVLADAAHNADRNLQNRIKDQRDKILFN